MRREENESFISIQLYAHEKQLIRDLTIHVISNEQTLLDLKSRKQWINFKHGDLQQVVGELSYHMNHINDDGVLAYLDELIGSLENKIKW